MITGITGKLKITGKLQKITENSRNLRENSLKNPKILSPRFARRGGWGSGFAGQGGFANFFDDRGFWLTPPPLAMSDNIATKKFLYRKSIIYIYVSLVDN